MSEDDENPIEEDPAFIGKFEIDDEGAFTADVFAERGATTENAEWDFRDMFDALSIDPNDKDFLLDQLTVELDQSDGNFDPADPDVRGAYDRDEVINFLDETGWWGIADIYYDEESDQYYIDINYDDGSNA